MIGDLQADVRAALALLPRGHPRFADLTLLGEALSRESAFIERRAADYPQALFQSVWNFCNHYAPGLASHWRGQKTRAGSLAPYLVALLPAWPPPGGGELHRVEPSDNGLRQLAVDTVHRMFVSACGEAIYFNDAETGQPRREPLRVTDFQTFALSDDRTLLAVASGESSTVFGRGAIDLYSHPDGQHLGTFPAHRGPIACLAFSGDRALLAAGHRTGVVRVYGVPDRTTRATLRKKGWGAVLQVVFDPGGARLYASFGGAPARQERHYYNSDCAVRCWELATRRLCWEFEEGESQRAVHLAVSHAGDELAVVRNTYGHGDDVCILSARTGAPLSVVKAAGEPECVCYAPDGRSLAIGCGDTRSKSPSVEIVSRDGSPPPVILDGHTGTVSAVVWPGSAPGPVSCSYDGTIRRWARPTAAARADTPHATSVSSVAFTPDGRSCLSLSTGDKVVWWSMPGGRVVHSFGEQFNHPEGRIVFSPNGRYFTFCGGHEGYLGTFGPDRLLMLELPYDLRHIGCAVFSADSERLYAGMIRPSPSVAAWDIEACRTLWSSPAAESVLRIALSDRKRLLATCNPYRTELTNDPDVTVRDAASGDVVATLRVGRAHPSQVLFSPDGALLVVCFNDGFIRFWECGRWARPSRRLRFRYRVLQAAFTATGSRLLCRCRGGVAAIDVSSGKWTVYRKEVCDLSELSACGGSRDWVAVEGGNDTLIYAQADNKLMAAFPGASAAHNGPFSIWAACAGKVVQFYQLWAAGREPVSPGILELLAALRRNA